MNKIVFKNIVQSRNFVSDFGAEIKNIVGGRLNTYEKMMDEGISKALDSLLKDYPLVKNIKMQVTEFTNKSIAITVYGEVEE